jgi:triacylglycerol lipase
MLVLAALAAVLVVVIAAVVIRSRPERARPVAQDDLGPVLLVPGYGGSTTGLDVMASALRAAGRDAIVVSIPDDAHGDLRAQADSLDSAVHAALVRTGADSVDVIGYSAGGVVARLWVRYDGGDSEARRIITLGSPHHGTVLAGAAIDFVPSECPTACTQLAPDSELLRSLNAGDETPSGPLYVSIRSSSDQVVPAYSSVLAGATNVRLQAVCPASRTTHGELPSDPLVIAITELELGTTPPAALTAADCGRLSS